MPADREFTADWLPVAVPDPSTGVLEATRITNAAWLRHGRRATVCEV
jgi:hypothetical protein